MTHYLCPADLKAELARQHEGHRVSQFQMDADSGVVEMVIRGEAHVWIAEDGGLMVGLTDMGTQLYGSE